MKKKILISLSQIFILIIGIFAIGYALGSEVEVVSGKEVGINEKCGDKNMGTCKESCFNDEDKVDMKYGDDCEKDLDCCVSDQIGCKLINQRRIPVDYYREDTADWTVTRDCEVICDKDQDLYARQECEADNTWDKQCECVHKPPKDTEETRSEEPEEEESTKGVKEVCGGGQGTCVPAQETGSGQTHKWTCPSPLTAVNPKDIFLDCHHDENLMLACCKKAETGEKDKNSNLNLPSYNTKKECQKKGGVCMGIGKESECKKQVNYNLECGTAEFCCISKTKEKKTKEEEAEKDKTTGDYKEAPWIGGTEWYAYLAGHIIEGATWATGLYFGVKTLIPILGVDESLADSYASALAGAVFAGKAITGFFEAFVPARTPEGKLMGWGGGVGTAAGIVYFLLAFRYETYEAVTFECIPWDAATSTEGDYCNECNNQGILPCSEYQCRSLGQGCELLNKGTDKEKCSWVNRGDVEFPRIEAWEEALINEDYEYEYQNTGISPPDRGVIIEYTPSTTGCIKAFTPLSFGVKLTNEDEEPEPAKCKFDTSRKDNFDNMRFYFSEGLLLEEHSYTLSLPGTGGDAEIENDGNYSVYVRCQDANGNYNVANFVFNFCVEKGPDTTPPLIVQTSIMSGMPIAFNQTSVDLGIYINEPVRDCKWSHLDQSYENMEGEIDCTGGDDLNEMNSQGLYMCETTLDGLNDRVENNFYFRCEDLSENINEESYKFTLMGTQPLVIDWAKPENGSLIKDSTEAVKVTLEAQTSMGYKDGESDCYFSDTGDANDYDLFFSDGGFSNYEHSQELWLPEGDYEYFIKCIDLGGNEDIETINFSVESDGDDPIIVRAYHEETYLKIITNEPAECVYDTKYENYPCDYAFDDGTSMNTLEDVNHYTSWNPEKTFYIICQDEFGNQPWPDGCSIIVRPSDLY